MLKRFLTSAAAALFVALPAFAADSEGNREAHDALVEQAPSAREPSLPDLNEPEGKNSQAGEHGKSGDDEKAAPSRSPTQGREGGKVEGKEGEHDKGEHDKEDRAGEHGQSGEHGQAGEHGNPGEHGGQGEIGEVGDLGNHGQVGEQGNSGGDHEDGNHSRGSGGEGGGEDRDHDHDKPAGH